MGIFLEKKCLKILSIQILLLSLHREIKEQCLTIKLKREWIQLKLKLVV